MSISATTRKAGPFNGSGSATAFPFTFKVFQASDVLVVQTDTTPTDYTLVLNTDYTVTLNGNQDSNPGGTVNMTIAPPTGYLLTIGSNVQQIQSVTLTNNGGFYPTVINAALDYVTVLIQQLSEKLGRALTLPFSTGTGVSTQLPPVSAGSLLGWKADGSGIANVGPTGVGAGGIVASNMAAGATGTALSADAQTAATKATPADTDKIPLFDSANFWYLKGLTWANLKAGFLNNGLSTITGSQMQISADLSPLYEGAQSTLASGAAYTLNGNLIMKAWTHNTKIDTNGNFTGVAETGVATCLLWGEDDMLRGFTAPSVAAGTVPTFGTTPPFLLDLKTGASTTIGLVCATRNLRAVLTAASSTLNFGADELIVSSALGSTAAKLANYNQNVNLAIVGNGGMDSGTPPVNGFVAIYASQTSAGLQGIFACNAATVSSGSTYSGANAPAGVARTALIGIWPTNASGQFAPGAILDPAGRKFQYFAFPTIFASHANIAAYTLQNISGVVPYVSKTASFMAGCATSATDFSAAITGDGSGYIGKAFNVKGATGAGVTTIGGAGGGLYAVQFLQDIPLLTAQAVYVEIFNGSALSSNYLYCSDYTW